jgi:TRAP-type mannitol/chloroaromatic compound transport system permease small subunit
MTPSANHLSESNTRPLTAPSELNNKSSTTPIYRILAASMIGYVIVFILNNYLIFFRGWPGPVNFLKHQQWLGFSPLRNPLESAALSLGWIQFLMLFGVLAITALWVFKTHQRQLRDDAKLWSNFAAYIIRTAFWAILFIGLIDVIISFLRVENYLEIFVGDELTKQLGRSSFRGTYVLYPMFIVGGIIAYFSKGLDFIWLALLVVIAEFLIVIGRFIFSYEQAFMGDLVRFYYAALFLFTSSYALVSGGHVRVDVLYASFSKRKKSITNIVGCLILGLPLCWTILLTGMWTRGSSLNGPILTFEGYQQGYGMYVKYIMVGFLIIYAVSMLVQFVGYMLDNIANLRGEEGDTYPLKEIVEYEGQND